MPDPKPARKPRGFAAMSLEKRTEIARKGGVAVHEAGTGHEFEKGSAEARAAGKKGGHAYALKKATERQKLENQR